MSALQRLTWAALPQIFGQLILSLNCDDVKQQDDVIEIKPNILKLGVLMDHFIVLKSVESQFLHQPILKNDWAHNEGGKKDPKIKGMSAASGK